MHSHKKNKKNTTLEYSEKEINTQKNKNNEYFKYELAKLKEIITRNMNNALVFKKDEVYSISEYNTVTQEYENLFSKILNLNLLLDGNINTIMVHC